MHQVRVTLSANAGVSIEVGGKRILVDAFHQKKQPGFSTVESQLFQKMLTQDAFSQPDYLCYTHKHSDHYDKKMTQVILATAPNAKLIQPEPELEGAVQLSGEEFVWKDGQTTIHFLKLPHEGALYQDTVHYGLLITAGDVTILLPGDCAVASPVLEEKISNRKINLAILDFPWVTLRKGREFLQKHLPADHILLYHLPFKEDDVNGYRSAAIRWAQQLSGAADIRLLMEPLQTETI